MKNILNTTKARSNLYKLVEHTHNTHEPIYITGKKNDAVLVSAQDWEAIQETLYLNSTPGMSQSIKEGLDTDLKDCVTEKDVKW